MAGTRVQQDVGGVQPAYSNKTYSIPAVTQTGSALSRARWFVFSFLVFFTLWLTFCEHERRQRWSSCPGTPRRIYFPPGECDAPHWRSSAGRFGAIGLLNMHDPPWDIKKRIDWTRGERMTFKAQKTKHMASNQGHIRGFSTQGCKGNILHLCQSCWSILQSAHKDTQPVWTIGPRCTHSHT